MGLFRLGMLQKLHVQVSEEQRKCRLSPEQGHGGTGVSQPEDVSGALSSTVLPRAAGGMQQVFPSSSSASSIARTEAQIKHLCSRGGEWDIVAMSKIKVTPPSLFPPQYLLKSLS